MLKFYGYINKPDAQLESLKEVTVQATTDELHRLIAFLTHAAEVLDKHPCDHMHFSDNDSPCSSQNLEFVIARPQ